MVEFKLNFTISLGETDLNQGPKQNPEAKESHEQHQRIFWTIRGHYPVKQGFWGKSRQKAQPKVRQNLCRKSSLGYFFCPWLNSEKGGIYESPPDRYVPVNSRNAIVELHVLNWPLQDSSLGYLEEWG